MKFTDYDPTWLVKLAEEQYLAEKWLAESLKECTRYCRQSDAYYYFMDPKNANKPGAEWQISENIILKHDTLGEIVLDVLKNKKIGGIEFIMELTGDAYFLEKCEKNKIFVD